MSSSVSLSGFSNSSLMVGVDHIKKLSDDVIMNTLSSFLNYRETVCFMSSAKKYARLIDKVEISTSNKHFHQEIMINKLISYTLKNQISLEFFLTTFQERIEEGLMSKVTVIKFYGEYAPFYRSETAKFYKKMFKTRELMIAYSCFDLQRIDSSFLHCECSREGSAEGKSADQKTVTQKESKPIGSCCLSSLKSKMEELKAFQSTIVPKFLAMRPGILTEQ